MGKELPTIDRLLKAMRGGLTLRGEPNPDPMRYTPSGKSTSQHPTNIMEGDMGDGFPKWCR